MQTTAQERAARIVGRLDALFEIGRAAGTNRPGAKVTSWVRADRAELDEPLAGAVASWLEDWPFERVVYEGRPELSDR